MVWDRPAVLTADTAYTFRFRLLDASGSPASDVQPYMGMAGHAAFVKTDGTVFAHTHPEGSAAMAALMLANEKDSGAMGHEGMSMDMPMSGRWLSIANRSPARSSFRMAFPLLAGTGYSSR